MSHHLFSRAAVLALALAGPAAAKQDSFAVGGGDDFKQRMMNWQGKSAQETVISNEVIGESHGRLAISSPFGWRSDPIQGMRRRHAGIDLPGPANARVFATGAGIVRFAGRAGGYGKMIEVDHPGGVSTRFGHLAQVFVRPGTQVAQGQVIGAMGSTGRSTGTHLHYEVRIGGRPVDPLAYIGQTSTSYRTVWSDTEAVAPRWAGWSHGPSLPQSTIR
jgi:murein DD-endopeptidase MepM/ murein hydrolase activator NlpD